MRGAPSPNRGPTLSQKTPDAHPQSSSPVETPPGPPFVAPLSCCPSLIRRLKQISEMRRRDEGARQLRAAELYEDIHDSMVPKTFDSEAVMANLDQVAPRRWGRGRAAHMRCSVDATFACGVGYLHPS